MILEFNAMYLKAFVLVVVLFLIPFFSNAQECNLGVGGKNSETLIKVFQLNEMQSSKMEALDAELLIETKTLEDAIQKLFDTHPQSTPEELTKLSEKYKVLEHKLIEAHFKADKELLSTFNEKQYTRYLTLCNEALRRPIEVVPISSTDSIVDPE